MAVGLDDLDRLVCVVVGEIALRLEEGPAFPLGGVTRHGPDHALDPAVLVHGVDDPRVVLREIERAGHVETVVEPLVLRALPGRPAEVPLPDVRRVVARRAEDFRDGHLPVRQPHLAHVGQLVQEVVADDRRQGNVRFAHPLGDGRPDPGERRELEAEPGGVAAGQDRRARRCAYGVRRVAVGERDAFVRDRVDVRRLDAAVRGAAVGERDVVVAKVVGEDQHDVGGTFAGRPRGGFRTRRPGRGHVGADGIGQVGEDRGAPHQEVEPVDPGVRKARDDRDDDGEQRLQARFPLVRPSGGVSRTAGRSAIRLNEL